MSTPNDLQALLASIRPRPSPPNAPGQEHAPHQRPQQGYPPGMFPPHPQHPPHPPPPYEGLSYPHPHPQPHGYHHPSVASAIQSPSPMNTPPHHGSDIISPNVPSPYPEWAQQQQHLQQQHLQQQQQQQMNNPDRAANLLNLLRFSQGPGAVPQPAASPAPEQARYAPAQETTSPHGRNISASDLVASLFGRPGGAPPGPPPVTQVVENSEPEILARGQNSSEDRQARPNPVMDLFRQVLNDGEPASASEAEDTQSASILAQASTDGPLIQEAEESFVELSETSPKGSAQPETVAAPTSNNSMFTYTNPFDQLAAISPRNKSPTAPSGPESFSPEVIEETIAHLAAGEPSAPTQPKKRSKEPELEPEQRQAVNDVVGRLVDEIGRSLSIGEAQPSSELEAVSPPTETESAQAAISIANSLLETTAEATEAIVSEESAKTAGAGIATAAALANGNQNTEALADSWESAEDSAEKEEERIVSVHNFPLKPFISINVKPQSGKFAVFRDDGIMDIARLKKDFDQLDRSLTAATSEYIVYALAKTGGIRIIRQDDGSDRQVFRSTRDRVFNVALCTSSSTSGSSDMQAILGIGVSGTVYWALISRHAKDLFEMDALESESLIFPPFPASDENTSGGQLKTRAKRSTRHPDLFAIGRGKNIYVVSPQAAMNASYGVTGSQRTVNTEKFFKERALKISTGKAGKDFAFSDDDTVIASLDKTGRLRFWDIREFLETSSVVEGPAPNEVRIPLNTFVTGSPAEKSWPTSVLFLDKLRAYSRSMALRYVLVGLKQNHTLQLWDIGLGKAVEEVKFPHENESDAICSVAYHPASGIIVVGHPTRNSIYFVHLSAPRYNLTPMSQATFIKAVAERDSTLPKPDSTACLSGIREISLGSKGQLRSLELLPINKSASDKRGQEETGLFELYVMHSRGVTCLNIKKEDLGWTSDNKVIRPVDGLEEGTIEITELQSFPSYVTDDPSVNGDAASIPSRTSKETAKKTDIVDSAAGVIASRNASPTKTLKKKTGEEQTETVSTTVPVPNGAEKADKKKKKKTSASSAVSEATVKAKEPTATVGVEPLPTDQTSGAPSTLSMAPISLDKHLESLQTTVTQQFNKSLGREMEGILSRLDEERRNWDAASSAKQDQVLRLVSSTLSDNVEKNLARIVSESIKTDVLPTITEATSAAVGKQLNSVVSQQLGGSLNNELRQALPKAVTNALQQPAVMKAVSDSVAQQLGPIIGTEISKAMQGSLLPVIEDMARGTKKLESDMERNFQNQIKHLEAQRRNDQAKMDEMSAMLRSLSSTVNTLVANQGQARQTENPVARQPQPPQHRPENRAHTPQRPVAQSTPQPVAPVAAPAPQPPVQASHPTPARAPAPAGPTAEEVELAEISRLFGTNHFEEASIKWIQSSQQADLFDNFFIRVNPQFLSSLSAIVMLSIGVAVTSSLSTNVGQRLTWLHFVLSNVNTMDNDLREIAPNIMNILGQRLNNLYMTVAERNPQDPILRMIAPLSRRARELNNL